MRGCFKEIRIWLPEGCGGEFTALHAALVAFLGSWARPFGAPPLFPAAEHLGESKPLGSLIRTRADLKVPTQGWRWSVEHPYPPVDNVLRSVFWSSDTYSAARARLRRPAPVVNMKGGVDFVTVTTGTATLVKESEGAQMGSAEVCT